MRYKNIDLEARYFSIGNSVQLGIPTPTTLIHEKSINMRVLALLPVFFGLPAFAELIDTQYPHLMLPLKSWAPYTPFKTQDDASVTYNVCTSQQLSLCLQVAREVQEQVLQLKQKALRVPFGARSL
jgi:hypothetical protein